MSHAAPPAPSFASAVSLFCSRADSRADPRASTLAWLCFALPLTSCGALSWEARSLEDDGTLCLTSEGSPFSPTPANLQADAALSITVNANECLSGSCSRATRASCRVELRDDEIRVVSHFAWEEKTRGGCTDDCNQLSATCLTPDLPEGSYVLRHGSAVHTITVPSMLAQSCLTRP